MDLISLDYNLTVCKVPSVNDLDLGEEFFFVGRTDEEISLVCLTESTPENTVDRNDGWKAFKVQGVLDFSLIGVLSNLTTILAENKIGVFVVSTFNTDYILVKSENFERSKHILALAGYSFVWQ